MSRSISTLTLSWPAPSAGFFLEFSETVTAAVWRRVTNGIMNLGDRFEYSVDLQTAPFAGFFRVRTIGLFIRGQPRPQTLFAGQPANFQVTASGSGPLRYQWYFGARRIIGGTNSVLTVPNVSRANAGSYRALVSD